MARSYGRLFTSIWNDQDFRPLSVGAKLMYSFLISQDDLEHSGIIPLRPTRWARDLAEPVEDIRAWLKELDETRFTVTDDEAGELLVRSLIRRDDIWKQPNVFKAAASSARNSKSPQIKGTLHGEILRLTLIGTNRETHAIRDELLSQLEPFANRSPNPPEGFPRGSGNPDRGLPEGFANGSGTPGEPLANPSAGVTGKGNGNGPVVELPLPHSPTPSPAASPQPSRPLWPSAVPDARAEEGDSFQDDPPDLAALTAEVRAVRPEWATKSIRRAMSEPSVRERPWPIARRAMLAVAADPVSKAPGRIAGDGPWWHQRPSERAGPLLPPWCGECDEETRMLGWDGDEPGPCPRCKPIARPA
jgi:hypothetical protein